MFENTIKKEFPHESFESLRDNFRLVGNIAAEKLKSKKNPHKDASTFKEIIYESIEEFCKDKNLKLNESEKRIYYREVGRLLNLWSQASLHEKNLNCKENDD